MSKRSWGGDFTLALVALTVLVFMVAITTALVLSEYAKVHSSNAAYQQNAERDRRIASEEIAGACADRTGEAFRLCIADRMEAYYRDQVTNEDLRAQQDMAFWAAALFISSTTLTAIGIWLLYMTLSATQQTLIEAGKTTDAANRTIEETRRIGEAQVRAYLSCTGASFIISGQMCKLGIDIQNFGQSPAREATVFGAVIAPNVNSKNSDDIFLRSNTNSFELFEIAATMMGNGTLLFPLPFGADVCRSLVAGDLILAAECQVNWMDVFDRWQTIDFYLTEGESEIISHTDHPSLRKGTMKASNAKPTQSKDS